MPSAAKNDLNAGDVLKNRTVRTIAALNATGSPLRKAVKAKGCRNIILKIAAAGHQENSDTRKNRSITGEKPGDTANDTGSCPVYFHPSFCTECTGI